MNLTLPSAIRALAPPEGLLVTLAKVAWLGKPPPAVRQSPHRYCVEFGGTMVLKIVIPLEPISQKTPRKLLRFVPDCHAVLHAARAVLIAVGFCLASYIWPPEEPETLTTEFPEEEEVADEFPTRASEKAMVFDVPSTA